METTPYEVLEKLGDIEIRSYPRIILATVDSAEDPFNILVRYIGGNNKGSRKIAMTTPVITPEEIQMTTPVYTVGSSMSFMMPTKYNLDDVPEPNDPRIRIHEVRPRKIAVIRFNGYSSERDIEKNTEKLLETLYEKGYEAVGEPSLLRYNPPWIPGFMRRNEIAVELAEKKD